MKVVQPRSNFQDGASKQLFLAVFSQILRHTLYIPQQQLLHQLKLPIFNKRKFPSTITPHAGNKNVS